MMEIVLYTRANQSSDKKKLPWKEDLILSEVIVFSWNKAK